jgi:hypothetical protein
MITGAQSPHGQDAERKKRKKRREPESHKPPKT